MQAHSIASLGNMYFDLLKVTTQAFRSQNPEQKSAMEARKAHAANLF